MSNKDMYEAKERYVENLMEENEKIETLSKKEHEMLADLCRLRHKFHCSYDEIWRCEYEHLDNLGEFIEDHNLPISFDYDHEDIISEEDYYLFLSDEEREEYGKKAEEINEANPNAAFKMSGLTCWMEEGAYSEFCDCMSNLNEQVEAYLRDIDKKHGTKYAPTGIARLLRN